ncbi:MAG: hypothetical protein ACKVI3_17970, partial [Verrucomicrobiia bacterium]
MAEGHVIRTQEGAVIVAAASALTVRIVLTVLKKPVKTPGANVLVDAAENVLVVAAAKDVEAKEEVDAEMAPQQDVAVGMTAANVADLR